MSSTVDALIVKRLSFIRFLFDQGAAQCERAEPFAASGLLTLHDAVEGFLLIAAEHIGAPLSKKTDFDGYWGEINAKLENGKQLPSRPAMRRLNNLRVGLKHHGTLPSKQDAIQSHEDVSKFLLAATGIVFGLDFGRLDLVDLVSQATAAVAIRQADAAAAAGDFVEGMALLSDVLDDLLDDYSDRKHSESRRGPYTFGPTLRQRRGTPIAHRMGRASRDAQVQQVAAAVSALEEAHNEVNEAAAEMQRALRVMAVGLDYRAYARFSMIVPRVWRTFDQARHVSAVAGLEYTREMYEFCKEFVVEASLQLAALDFDLDLVEVYRTSQRSAASASDSGANAEASAN